MRRQTTLPALALPALLLAACSDGSGGDGAAAVFAEVDTIAGRIEVANTGESIWTAETAWRLEEDLRLGTLEGAGSEPEQFGNIESIATDSRGRIYVLEWDRQEIRVFDSVGTYSHTIGRRGQGPGELSAAWTLSIGPGDTLTVLDDGAMRFSVFAPDGAFIQSHRRNIVGYGAPLRSRLDDGGYLDWAQGFPDGRPGPRLLYRPVRHAPGFGEADTFPPIDYTMDMVPSGRIRLLLWGGFVVAAAGADGTIWFADSREYRVYRRTLEGDTTLVFSLQAEPAPLGEPERQQLRERWARRPDILDEQLEALPETKPVVYGVVPDGSGHVFVFPDVAGEPPGSVVDVFRESGEYLGRRTLPSPVPLEPGRPPVVHVTPEHLYVVTKDELDVPYVSRLRIERGR